MVRLVLKKWGSSLRIEREATRTAASFEGTYFGHHVSGQGDCGHLGFREFWKPHAGITRRRLEGGAVVLLGFPFKRPQKGALKIMKDTCPKMGPANCLPRTAFRELLAASLPSGDELGKAMVIARGHRHLGRRGFVPSYSWVHDSRFGDITSPFWRVFEKQAQKHCDVRDLF